MKQLYIAYKVWKRLKRLDKVLYIERKFASSAQVTSNVSFVTNFLRKAYTTRKAQMKMIRKFIPQTVGNTQEEYKNVIEKIDYLIKKVNEANDYELKRFIEHRKIVAQAAKLTDERRNGKDTGEVCEDDVRVDKQT